MLTSWGLTQEAFLDACLRQYLNLRSKTEALLGQLFIAGDVDGDGELTLDEFSTIVCHIDANMSEREVREHVRACAMAQRLTVRAQTDGCNVPGSASRFRRHEEGSLCQGLPRPRTHGVQIAAQTFCASTSNCTPSMLPTFAPGNPHSVCCQNEADHFALLQTTWDDAAADVEGSIATIEDEAARVAVEERVLLLKQVRVWWAPRFIANS